MCYTQFAATIIMEIENEVNGNSNHTICNFFFLFLNFFGMHGARYAAVQTGWMINTRSQNDDKHE